MFIFDHLSVNNDHISDRPCEMSHSGFNDCVILLASWKNKYLFWNS